MMQYRINVKNDKIVCYNEGDLSGSESRGKFWWCNCFISCFQRQNIQEVDSEGVERCQLVYVAQSDTEKVPEELSNCVFH